MKKVLQVVPCMELGGTEAFIMNNYRVLDRSKYQFDFLIFREKEYPYLEEIQKLGGHFFFSGTPSLGNVCNFIMRFKEIVREGGPYDAVHCHANIDNGIPLLAAYLCKIPIRVSHSHGTSGKDVNVSKKPWYLLKEYLVKKYATTFLACSVAAGKYLYGKELFTQKGKMIPNGIDVKCFLNESKTEVESLKTQWSIKDNCPLIVGNITRFEEKKNSLFTIKVFYEILKYVPEAILIMGGPDGGQLDACKRLAASLEIENHIRFVGKRRDIPACLKVIDIYLFPSLSEGLSIAFLEAQASGCFCVASDGVSNEADRGLGSALYIPLEKNAIQWAELIMDSYSAWKKTSNDLIMEKFIESGFEIREAHKRLMAVYEGK